MSESPTADPLDVQPVKKRQRQAFVDDPNKQLAPARTSGRIRIKMEAAAAAEQQKIHDQQQQQQQQQQEQSKTIPKPPVVIKHRRRRRPKLNGDANCELQIDVKRPNSVLVDTSIRALLTNFAFSQLSPENQKILVESLPLVDRPVPGSDSEPIELNPSSINNEFFNRACIEWRDRLAYGEFTNEHQTKLKAEQERDKSKIDPWKARNFEGIWGIKATFKDNLGSILEKSAMEVRRMEQDDFDIPEGFINEMWKVEEAAAQQQQSESDENKEMEVEPEAVEEENSEDADEEENVEETDVNCGALMMVSVGDFGIFRDFYYWEFG